MSLVNLAHVCSHLQNASKARLGITAIPATKLHMGVAHQLQKSGFISTVTLGGLTPPPVSSLLAHPPAPPLRYRTPEVADSHRDLTNAVDIMQLTPTERAPYHPSTGAEQGSLVAQRVVEGQEQEDDNNNNNNNNDKETPVWEMMTLPEHLEQPDRQSEIPSNPAKRRIWLGLKYWNNEPVLRKIKLISKPTRRIWMDSKDFALIARGRKAGYVDGLNQIGECMYVTTDRGIMEIRECLERNIGGMMLCRAW